jgi:hypothetical protein
MFISKLKLLYLSDDNINQLQKKIKEYIKKKHNFRMKVDQDIFAPMSSIYNVEIRNPDNGNITVELLNEKFLEQAYESIDYNIKLISGRL